MERKELALVLLLGVLLVTTAMQTIQLIGVSNAQVTVTGAVTKAAPSGSSSGSSGSGSSGLPANIQNLPGMVGGC